MHRLRLLPHLYNELRLVENSEHLLHHYYLEEDLLVVYCLNLQDLEHLHLILQEY
jgi:hypothetical protein